MKILRCAQNDTLSAQNEIISALNETLSAQNDTISAQKETKSTRSDNRLLRIALRFQIDTRHDHIPAASSCAILSLSLFISASAF